MSEQPSDIKAIIGLGNPGPKYYSTRHSIGFRVLDELAKRYVEEWQTRDDQEYANIRINERPVILIKPQTFMNSSGRVIPGLLKKGIRAENILVIHDELEIPFSTLKFKMGGSHRGHNGLRSIMEVCGKEFMRLRFGIGRPEDEQPIDQYVLSPFGPSQEVELLIAQASDMVEALFK